MLLGIQIILKYLDNLKRCIHKGDLTRYQLAILHKGLQNLAQAVQQKLAEK